MIKLTYLSILGYLSQQRLTNLLNNNLTRSCQVVVNQVQAIFKRTKKGLKFFIITIGIDDQTESRKS